MMLGEVTPYSSLNLVLGQLVDGMREALDESFLGTYLQGSFAVGDFDEHSDVDFIAVVEDEITDAQLKALQALHARLYALPISWAQHLEGSYFPKDVLRFYQRAGSELWFLDHGAQAMVRSDHCNTIIVRATLREYGIPLDGPSPASLINPVPTEMVRRSIFEDIQQWGNEILQNPERFNNRFYQGFIVLSYCRMVHDLVRGRPGSKRAGAEWAKSSVAKDWAQLVDAAWQCRPDPAWQVRQRADPDAFRQTLVFVAYMMEKSRSIAGQFDLDNAAR